MKTNDFQAAMEAFLKNNPDLPEGEEINEQPADTDNHRGFRMDVVLEKKVAQASRLQLYAVFKVLTTICWILHRLLNVSSPQVDRLVAARFLFKVTAVKRWWIFLSHSATKLA